MSADPRSLACITSLCAQARSVSKPSHVSNAASALAVPPTGNERSALRPGQAGPGRPRPDPSAAAEHQG